MVPIRGALEQDPFERLQSSLFGRILVFVLQAIGAGRAALPPEPQLRIKRSGPIPFYTQRPDKNLTSEPSLLPPSSF